MVIFQYIEIVIEFFNTVIHSEVFISIATSLIAGSIFYYIVEYKPSNKRKKRAITNNNG